MIVARTPFRISFAGGGSDIPSYYRQAASLESAGAVVSTTIDKYIYIVIHPYFHNKLRIRYAKTEDVDRVEEIQHPLVRECLQMLRVDKGMEIASFADVPAGTGMGSSSAFTVCLLHALHALRSHAVTAEHLAEQACDIEINRAHEPIGKQDQYATTFGGLNYIRFHKNESVEVAPIRCSVETKSDLEQHLMLFYVGQERPARSILIEQGQNMSNKDKLVRVEKMVELASELRRVLEKDDISSFGEILDEGWKLKSCLAAGISNSMVETNYKLAKEAGAAGGKLLGAGGGGFLLLFCRPERQSQVREALSDLREMQFKMTASGSQVIHNDETHAANVAALPAYSMRG
jgi:D-glycero-alpha-D-manno-heptose-7-phosphate kinase